MDVVETKGSLYAHVVAESENCGKFVRIHQSDGPEGAHTKVWLQSAATMLTGEWPRGGSAEKYAESMLVNARGLQNISYALPCSYLHIMDDTCVGHARLTECFEGFGGSAAAATFVIVQKSIRGQRLGTKLMTLLEEEAERLGYHYVYLWTKTAVGFYEKLGYSTCERVSLHRPCLKMLKESELTGLEAMLASRMKRIAKAAESSPTTENATSSTASKVAEDVAAADDVWLRKRLVEELPSRSVSMDVLTEQMRSAVVGAAAVPGSTSATAWRYQVVLVPWQRQIGPSCGLAALRMARDHFVNAFGGVDVMGGGGDGSGDTPQMPSLLREAQERGFSKDGEVFDASNLVSLATQVCGLDSDMRSFSQTSSQDVLQSLRAGHLYIIPYDSHSGSKQPCTVQGRSAHYGVVIGLLFRPQTVDHDCKCRIAEEPVVGSHGSPCDPYCYGNTSEELVPCEDGDEVASDDANVYLVVQHSVSANLAIATYAEFLKSNLQLETVDASRFGGQVRLNLKDRLVRIKGLA